jgi:hypothetical protein
VIYYIEVSGLAVAEELAKRAVANLPSDYGGKLLSIESCPPDGQTPEPAVAAA